MELKKGYKQTEIGIIPEDWDLTEMRNIGKAIIGLTYSPHNVKLSGILVHRSSNIQGNSLAYHDNVYVDVEVDDKLILREHDILICVRNGSRDLIGKSALITGKSIGETFGAFMSVFRTNYPAAFVYQLFISNIIQRQINQSLGATINQITNKTINEFKIPLAPTLTEQRLIASTLSDAEALISSLEKLIAKKKAIKQGTMQQLLTGKKRLPGFSGEWEVKKLGDVLKIKHGKSQKQVENLNGQYPILGTGGLMSYTNQYLYDKPSVLIGRKGTIDKPQFMNTPFWTVDTLFYSEIKSGVSPKFIYYQFLLIDWYSYNEASGVPSLNAKTIENIEIPIPDYKEQIAISNILSDMDGEIAECETKSNKYKSIKQGMMQELLTGKTRLV